MGCLIVEWCSSSGLLGLFFSMLRSYPIWLGVQSTTQEGERNPWLPGYIQLHVTVPCLIFPENPLPCHVTVPAQEMRHMGTVVLDRKICRSIMMTIWSIPPRGGHVISKRFSFLPIRGPGSKLSRRMTENTGNPLKPAFSVKMATALIWLWMSSISHASDSSCQGITSILTSARATR